MEVLHPRCAGLDVHKDTVVTCVRIQDEASVRHIVESVGTTTKELLRLADWLSEHEVTHVAMEATGVYWKAVWHVLEDSFELVLANAAHIKNVPGRKTDVNDATWIADLLAHGLIRGETDPGRLLALTTGRLKADRKALKEALRGRVREPHRFLLKLHLEQVENLEKAVESIDTEVGAVLEPFRAKVARLMTMPG